MGKFTDWGIIVEDADEARQMATGMIVEKAIGAPLTEYPDHQAVFCVGLPFMFSSRCLRRV